VRKKVRERERERESYDKKELEMSNDVDASDDFAFYTRDSICRTGLIW
jgi:hypothetical protein